MRHTIVTLLAAIIILPRRDNNFFSIVAHQMLTDLQNFFTAESAGLLEQKNSYRISQNLESVATVPCDVWVRYFALIGKGYPAGFAKTQS